jgi:hypothetical protein
MPRSGFIVRVLGEHAFRPKSMRWRAAELVAAMDGCTCESVICALTALEIGCPPFKVGKPARWLTHFAGLESVASGKAMKPWIEIIHNGLPVSTKTSFWAIVADRREVSCHSWGAA